ncbi:TadE/TadG family type IV pilus assembly protein [Acetobacter sp.]|jgi:Flp pilus assembly protein TadG|uniref:TadE/TadG family type IV pilus assembly protein n=1 Tax=Acetobacter sp. TaxID=440 RepID=UPI0025C4EC86|nr:TadE/TadG family type IV pilus assembly protein [Acetobacter sp.]MCH4090686.1 pilus assembly protein [Acetobacter sp.]MCI1300129.1 pilus assembly protein [Acetobacter sp.]MCI1316547.1 pilus assembly protein [Acetobacter sp.]
MKSFHAFLRAREGVAAVEFALITPILLIMLIGGTALEEAVVVSRKVTGAAHALADVTTQYTSVADSDLTLALQASTLVLEPYPSSSAKMTVSEIMVASNGQSGTVVWSRALNTDPRTVGASVAIPAGSTTSTSGGTYLILGEISYNYTPRVANNIVPGITFYQSLFMVPRRSTSIPLGSSSN